MVERKSSAFKSRFSRASKWLGREFGAALATAGSQDGATGTGLHALAKTVGLCAATGIWLESTLAHNHSPFENLGNLVGVEDDLLLPPIPSETTCQI
jgi:hypothetical protein